jgi:regulatory protein
MIRDDQFAASWVESRNEFHPRSQRLIRFELRNKGIKEEVITEALQHSENDQQMAEKAAEKMKNRYTGLDWQNFRNKFSAYLVRKGFTYDVINVTVKKTWDELQSEKTMEKIEDLGE